ncbi:MAG: phosphoribosylamine--glycine ligase [Candidatus Omnitrophica bacterium CG1_02_40_15]|nr:MAG: phosphoribosylamine--glycine ligase [Candidatus Omnitrophica bacterium CG1_02_40_15]
MNVLVIGSGGREHAIVWKLSQSKKVKKIFCAPGNSGIKEIAELVDVKPDDVPRLLDFAKNNKIDLTVVGPEAPLVKGIVDIFNENGLKAFGPFKDVAMLEGSKVFSKNIMKKFGLATADFKVFDNPNNARKYLNEIGVPIVIKADGLAAGKGVIIPKTIEEGLKVIDSIMVERIFGDSGNRIILEDCLEGEEVSMLVFTDGKTIVPLESSQDHKRIFDKDKGPNTGGMGAYSPAPIVTKDMLGEIIKGVFRPVVDGLKKEGKVYKGVLYAGLMITKNGPMVLEFNVRFGDPETQAILPRLKSDLADIMMACADGTLDKIDVKWDKSPCISVVCASKGYPDGYEKDKEIFGLEEAKKIKDVIVFHAGTKNENGKIFTNGGRVLGVTSLGKDIKSAKLNAYKAIEHIRFEGMQYRKDIGDRAIKRRS